VLDVSAEQSRSLEVLSALANEQASLQRALLDALIRLCNHNHHLEELIVVMTSGRDEGGVEDEGIPTHDLSGDPIRVR
jgi:hypothetical protein